MLTGITAGDHVLASQDSGEVYVFKQYRAPYLRYEVNALTGVERYRFGYDAAGHLAKVIEHASESADLVTTVERDASGTATAIVGPVRPNARPWRRTPTASLSVSSTLLARRSRSLIMGRSGSSLR